MAIDRQGTGLAVLRILLGIFFLSQGLTKLRWFIDPSILSAQLSNWQQTVPPASYSAQYLQMAVPHVAAFARLVPIDELACGASMILGVWTPVFSLIAFLMTLSFHLASGALFHLNFLANGFGFPVLGGTLALVLGGVRLPWSLR